MKKTMVKAGIEPAPYRCRVAAITAKLLMLDCTKRWVILILVAVFFVFYLGLVEVKFCH